MFVGVPGQSRASFSLLYPIYLGWLGSTPARDYETARPVSEVEPRTMRLRNTAATIGPLGPMSEVQNPDVRYQ